MNKKIICHSVFGALLFGATGACSVETSVRPVTEDVLTKEGPSSDRPTPTSPTRPNTSPFDFPVRGRSSSGVVQYPNVEIFSLTPQEGKKRIELRFLSSDPSSACNVSTFTNTWERNFSYLRVVLEETEGRKDLSLGGINYAVRGTHGENGLNPIGARLQGEVFVESVRDARYEGWLKIVSSDGTTFEGNFSASNCDESLKLTQRLDLEYFSEKVSFVSRSNGQRFDGWVSVRVHAGSGRLSYREYLYRQDMITLSFEADGSAYDFLNFSLAASNAGDYWTATNSTCRPSSRGQALAEIVGNKLYINSGRGPSPRRRFCSVFDPSADFRTSAVIEYNATSKKHIITLENGGHVYSGEF